MIIGTMAALRCVVRLKRSISTSTSMVRRVGCRFNSNKPYVIYNPNVSPWTYVVISRQREDFEKEKLKNGNVQCDRSLEERLKMKELVTKSANDVSKSQ